MVDYSTGIRISASKASSSLSEDESREYWEAPTVHRSKMKKDKRASTIQLAVKRLDPWQHNKWESEADLVTKLRLALISQGFSFTLAEAEAYDIVRAAFIQLGRGVETRPTWEMGQKEFTIPREDCQRCGAELDAEDIANRVRYCSRVCSDSARLNNPHHHTVIKARVTQAVRYDRLNAEAPLRECAYCDCPYRSADPDQKYCGLTCSARAQPDYRPDRQCKVCNETFRPENEDHWLCSFNCAGAAKRTRPDKTCPVCDTVFHPHRHDQITCSRDCYEKDRVNRLHHLDCIVCQTPFTNPKSTARFCCKKCENAFYRARPKPGPDPDEAMAA